jgi:AcrR family transcriptional regulator
MQTRSGARDRRTQIIEAAIGQLAEHGDSGATFARIVEAGGLSSPGLISYHFADRGELLESVYLYVAELRRAANDRALAGSTDPVARLRTALRADTEFFAARPELFAAVVEAFHGLRDPAGRLKHLGETRSEDKMLELLRAAGEASATAASAGPAETDLRSLALIIDGAQTQFLALLHRRPELDVEAFIRTLTRVALTGIGRAS